MKKKFCVALAALGCFTSLLVFAKPTFPEIEKYWSQSKGKFGYAEYQAEFVQYNNYLHLDTRDGCFKLSPGKLRMYLVISAHAVVESVVTDLDNQKAKCFKRTYVGLPVKAPPFSPFVIGLTMEDDHR